jgi:hypothetical protein
VLGDIVQRVQRFGTSGDLALDGGLLSHLVAEVVGERGEQPELVGPRQRIHVASPLRLGALVRITSGHAVGFADRSLDPVASFNPKFPLITVVWEAGIPVVAGVSAFFTAGCVVINYVLLVCPVVTVL